MSQSLNSQSEISSSNDGVRCDCNKPAKVVRAWTRENPGHRFWSCRGRRVANGWDSCNFFRWPDVEAPDRWQHLALLEARDTIREQKEEIASLRQKVTLSTHGCDNSEISSKLMERMKEKNEECEALNREVLIIKERSLVLKNVLVASSIEFAVVIGGLMVISKY
ncbi:unnamed protein product [Eruca vesicaria subsp. sativa]|uniref:GRF-type domain-containing protein n=1 Tax=Eruca vesicaria subsp. sativa TaxID=29727 RepID=A0ABC8IZJ5_ERUVS|nr:unnamed protein product [Eruca vesicaria subsp. sativa]